MKLERIEGTDGWHAITKKGKVYGIELVNNHDGFTFTVDRGEVVIARIIVRTSLEIVADGNKKREPDNRDEDIGERVVKYFYRGETVYVSVAYISYSLFEQDRSRQGVLTSAMKLIHTQEKKHFG